MSTIRSTPLVTHTNTRYEFSTIIGSFIGLLIGAICWMFGARYTVDGLILGSNMMLSFLTIPYHIAPQWHHYLWLAPFPFVFSAVEWSCSPLGKHRVTHGGLIIAWLFVVSLDIGSTLMGLAAATSPALVVWIVSTTLGMAILSLVLTFGPEALMKSCSSLLRRAITSRMPQS